MFSGGIGSMEAKHVGKEPPEPGKSHHLTLHPAGFLSSIGQPQEGGRELNPGLLKEQPVFLSPEPSFNAVVLSFLLLSHVFLRL